MLLQRLKNHKTMNDGITWSAQADFLARLANWEVDDDPLWHFQQPERHALLGLNVPHFVTAGNGGELGRAADALDTKSSSDLDVASARLDHLDDREIAWQIEIIRQNSGAQAKSVGATLAGRQQKCLFALKSRPSIGERSLYRRSRSHSRRTISVCDPTRSGRRLDRPGLAGRCGGFSARVLGPRPVQRHVGELLSFLRHTPRRCNDSSAELALAAVAHLRKNLRSRNAARMARSLGTGGAVGLGSIVYALCTCQTA